MMAGLVSFDWAVKKLLRNKANFDVLEGFLSELLGIDVKVEQLLESESNKQYEEDKYNRVDILVRTEQAERSRRETPHRQTVRIRPQRV
jgi:hypothetical protein